MMVSFTQAAWADYLDWQKQDTKLWDRINQIIKECCRTPFDGMGKPEPLRGDLKGYWSRRINREHRLIYRVSGADDVQTVLIISCRFHYT